ncbi:YceI family protein [Ancylobacter sp. G4_0304]|uniref:YceI family protein n=1 Tax=Ancylobacter sp. G4_0304 TaxID=3114289 RepID=UPI0039C747BA
MMTLRPLALAFLIASGGLAGAQDMPTAPATQNAPAPQGEPAEPDLPGLPDPTRISGGTYTVDANHTQVIWSVDHMGFSPLSGMFGGMSGTLKLDPNAPEDAVLEITIPMSGLVVTSKSFGEDLAGPEFFDAAKFPAATFKSTQISTDGTSATIEGELTLHGVTRPVTLDAELVGAGINPRSKVENIGFMATTMLNRSDFGLGAAVPMVSDEVELSVVGAFAKAP